MKVFFDPLPTATTCSRHGCAIHEPGTPTHCLQCGSVQAQGQIFVTGNTVIDALHMVVEKLKNDPKLAAGIDDSQGRAGGQVRSEVGPPYILLGSSFSFPIVSFELQAT